MPWMHWRVTCSILAMFFKVGMLPLSIPALGFMLHAMVIIVWPVCKLIYDFFTGSFVTVCPYCQFLFFFFSFFAFGQWSWKCRTFWSTGFTTWKSPKFAVLVSCESYIILLSKFDCFLEDYAQPRVLIDTLEDTISILCGLESNALCCLVAYVSFIQIIWIWSVAF